jgi:diacylglycerol kinase (ATP)
LERALLILNPAAGRGRGHEASDLVRGALTREGWTVEVAETRGPNDSETLERVNDGYDLLLPVGGDGTLHEALNHWRGPERHIPLMPIPAGSGNSLALDLEVEHAEDAVRGVLSGRRRALDGIRVTLDGDRVLRSANIVGWGAAARINARAERFRWAGQRRYDVSSACEILSPILPWANATVDGARDLRSLLGVASVTRHSGRGMQVAPDAVHDDGLFDVVTIRRGFRPRLLVLLAAVQSGAHTRSGLVEQRRAHTLELEIEDHAGLVVDGEWIAARRARLEILPELVQLWC